MAKKGEGDARWIVENREDGKNVNNWHWSETDCINYAKKNLSQMLSNLSFSEDPKITTGDEATVTVTGECTANVRKGKTIFYYEMEVKVAWHVMKEGAISVKGQLHAPYVSEEVDDDKVEVKVTVEGSGAEHVTVVREKGAPLVQKRICDFLKQLKEEYTVKRPGAPSASSSSASDSSSAVTTAPAPVPASAPAEKKKESATSSKKTIKIKDEFQTSGENVYNMMIRPDMLNAIMQGSAQMDPKEGGKFSLFGGAVVGENVKLVPGTQIVQKWRFTSWPEGVYSTVDIEITQKSGKSIVQLTQTGVPTEDAERTEQGWKSRFWGPGKQIFGFGSSMF